MTLSDAARRYITRALAEAVEYEGFAPVSVTDEVDALIGLLQDPVDIQKATEAESK